MSRTVTSNLSYMLLSVDLSVHRFVRALSALAPNETFPRHDGTWVGHLLLLRVAHTLPECTAGMGSIAIRQIRSQYSEPKKDNIQHT